MLQPASTLEDGIKIQNYGDKLEKWLKNVRCGLIKKKKKGNRSFSENCLSLIINRSHAEHESTLSCCREKGKCQTDMQIESSFRKPKLNSSAVLSESLRPQLNTASSCGHQISKIMSTNNRSFSAINESYYRYKNNL